jgi:hypothetical protein
MFAGLFTAIALGVVLLTAIEFIFHPWAFYLGGHFHPLPFWQGVSRVHRADGDYVLYFNVEPTNSGRYSRLPTFKGRGYLCTPRGERFPLVVYARLMENARFDTDGKEMKIEFKRRPWYFQLTGDYDRRPRVTFDGRWDGSELIGDDGGSFAAAFQPDGTLGKKPYDYYHANAPNKLPMTFEEVRGLGPYRTDCRLEQ